MEADDVFLHGRNRPVLDHQTLTSKYLIWTLEELSLIRAMAWLSFEASPAFNERAGYFKRASGREEARSHTVAFFARSDLL